MKTKSVKTYSSAFTLCSSYYRPENPGPIPGEGNISEKRHYKSGFLNPVFCLSCYTESNKVLGQDCTEAANVLIN